MQQGQRGCSRDRGSGEPQRKEETLAKTEIPEGAGDEVTVVVAQHRTRAQWALVEVALLYLES